MKKKNLINIMIVANLITLIPLLLNLVLFYVTLVFINAVILGAMYQLYIWENNFSREKIKSINKNITLIGSICFVSLFLPNIDFITMPLSQVFGILAGFLLINYKYEKSLSN